MEKEETFNLVKAALAESLDVAPEAVTPAATLGSLNLDSFRLLEVMFDLELRFDITFPDTDNKPQTVGELVELIDTLRASR
jgi:acyl carrier protein